MKISPDLISILRCPQNQQSLILADDDLLTKLNQSIAQQQLTNHHGDLIDSPLEAGLLTTDQQRLYPIKDGFPVMLIDEAIDLEKFE
ncbi:MAG: hypothetical protein L3J39_09920 [Verrucomicrobiales bacterium]|nr:hypothetical protein [Verrucomicrobiales bacterium]